MKADYFIIGLLKPRLMKEWPIFNTDPSLSAENFLFFHENYISKSLLFYIRKEKYSGL